ncbi:pyridoxal-phosphate dependent enzyme [Azospirillum sp. YIM B02556]|uniref:L-serine ammonia-lyase n=1 Tax=Azospirillum endophyticum TaxID=2800326 RepID=A0ABS1F833_9PROT|nr:pyridoxal-phosphate dependent enzyme [Azospirillum endophyticum]MBK1839572.1 pyridoxal-phosphate dependent enzyme [Azospirillum endophyticum]
MKPLHIETPLIESRPLSAHAGRGVWLKMEAAQPSGSFKLRGIGRACQDHARRGATRFVSSSGGNAGIAVAYAGRRLGIPVTVVVPETTSDHAVALLRQEEADVVVHGPSWQEANAHAQSLMGGHDAFLHPFDDELLWDGHAGMIDEVARTGWRPDAVVVSVGGGGLMSGVIQGLRRNGWPGVPVIAVETHGAESLAQSVAAGHRIELPRITSIATSLGARQVCARAFDLAMDHPVVSVVVTDGEAVQACLRFLHDHRVLVEPACGASLALAYGGHAALQPFEKILAIVCGGATTTIETLQAFSG